MNPSSEQIIVSTTFELPKKNQKSSFKFFFSRTKTKSLPDKLISVPDSGLVAIPITVDPKAESVTITVSYFEKCQVDKAAITDQLEFLYKKKVIAFPLISADFHCHFVKDLVYIICC